MDLYPAVLAFLKDHGLHKTATMLEREADCQIPVEAHPNLLDPVSYTHLTLPTNVAV